MTIDFKDLEITIGDLAKKKMKIDFEKKFEDILKLQKKPSKKEQQIINRIVYLNEEILTLETLTEKENSCWGYNKPKDTTLKIIISPLEFNEKLRTIDLELQKLGDKLNIQDIGDFKYKKIEKVMDYDEWLSENKDELKDNWEDYLNGCEDENEKEFIEFDEF